MDIGSSLPAWLTPVAWIYLVACLVSAGVLVYTVYGRGHRPQNRVMAPTWSNGQVTRVTLLKRQMYGRARFDLLRARILLA